ncbi:MAG: hypothetical protein OXB86_06060 [Bdellovibrionales bacterium]|nr:hypothetical protein [Bdellovibrionales bacterium]
MCKFLYFFNKGPALKGKLFLLSFLLFLSHTCRAFISDIVEAKKQIEGFTIALKGITDTLDDMGGFKDMEKEYLAYEKELKEFQKTVDEYEELGIDVRDFTEMRNYNSGSIKGQIDFFRNYIKRTNTLVKSLQAIMGSPETIAASEQIETNRTLRALLEDSQARELRRLRKEIAEQRILLKRRKKEKEFIKKQYAYINRHSKRKGFGMFHPFHNSKEKEKEEKKFKRKEKKKKFLWIF